MSATVAVETLEPERFGPSRHGVHISQSEDGAYIAYGHPDARRVLAAINSEARDYDYKSSLDKDAAASLLSAIEYRYMNEFVQWPDTGEWQGKWCERDAKGAIPVTQVYP